MLRYRRTNQISIDSVEEGSLEKHSSLRSVLFLVSSRKQRREKESKMHLWPSIRIRDSFKTAYLKKLEWNLHRMKSEKTGQSQQQNSNQRKLLDDDSENETSNPENGVSDETPMMSKAALVVKEILMLLTCCYCCFCCGACVDQEEA